MCIYGFLEELLDNNSLDSEMLNFYFKIKNNLMSKGLILKDIIQIISMVKIYFTKEIFYSQSEEYMMQIIDFIVSLKFMNMFDFLHNIFRLYFNVIEDSILLSRSGSKTWIYRIMNNHKLIATDFEMADFNLFCDTLLFAIGQNYFPLKRKIKKNLTVRVPSYKKYQRNFNYKLYKLVLDFKRDNIAYRPNYEDMPSYFPGTFDINTLTPIDFGHKEDLNKIAFDYLIYYDKSLVKYIADMFMLFYIDEDMLISNLEKKFVILEQKSDIISNPYYFYKVSGLIEVYDFFHGIIPNISFTNKLIPLKDLDHDMQNNLSNKQFIFFPDKVENIDFRYSVKESYFEKLKRNNSFYYTANGSVYEEEEDFEEIDDSIEVNLKINDEIEPKGYDLKTYLNTSGENIFFNNVSFTLPKFESAKQLLKRRYFLKKVYLSNNNKLDKSYLDIKSNKFKIFLKKIKNK